jgi:hypothetical protein
MSIVSISSEDDHERHTALHDRIRGVIEQQTELAAVIKAAVDLTSAEQFPGEERLQGQFRAALPGRLLAGLAAGERLRPHLRHRRRLRGDPHQ